MIRYDTFNDTRLGLTTIIMSQTVLERDKLQESTQEEESRFPILNRHLYRFTGDSTMLILFACIAIALNRHFFKIEFEQLYI
mmetsp:Transcript_23587/g.52445  ORF Transcript_23587/g.52445 Transcript_23587/m.52445 type:complete len:82 (-) Transcript_23587:1939-2184(-)